jgi:nucleotide-binding universal stress UspA family protein
METLTPFTHILAPIDGSACSIGAGQMAVQLAAAFRAEITFLYVVDNIAAAELARAAGRPAEQIQREMEVNGQRYLRHLAHQAIAKDLTVHQTISFGVPYTEIADLAKREGASLIVIGQIGRHGPRRLMMGSVTERVIELAPCPVMVVKPSECSLV